MSPRMPAGVTPELWSRVHRDGEWYRRNRAALMKTHPGRFVAIHDGAVKAHSATIDDLLADLRSQQMEPRHCVVEYVPQPGESLQMIRSF